jgi:hypothetical protein
MENVLSAGSAAGGATGGYSGAGAVQYGPTSLRSLPPYPNPPVPARYYPTYNTPWLVRVSWGGGGSETRDIVEKYIYTSIYKKQSGIVLGWC